MCKLQGMVSVIPFEDDLQVKLELEEYLGGKERSSIVFSLSPFSGQTMRIVIFERIE